MRARATGLSVLSAVTFGSSGPLAKAVLTAGWSAPAVAAVRIGLAAVLLLPLVAVLRPRALEFRGRDWWLLLGYGLLGVTGAQLFFFLAVARIPVSVAMLLEFLAPALVALWIRVIRRTPLPGPVWLGIALAILGLALVAQVWQGVRLDLLGIGAGLCSAVSTAGYFLIGEHGAGKHDPFGLTAVGLVVGAVPVFALCPPWRLPVGRLDAATTLGGWHPPVWLVLLALAVLSTVVPYLTGVTALRDLPSAPASVLGLLEPLVATLLAWLLLGQALGPVQLLGAAVLLTGAVLVQLTGPVTPPDVPAPA